MSNVENSNLVAWRAIASEPASEDRVWVDERLEEYRELFDHLREQ